MNTFGKAFRVTTFGESHGKGIGCVIDGMPAGVEIDNVLLDSAMQRRKGGQSAYTTPRKETDSVEILSGVFEGKSTGAPIALFIANNNTKSSDYSDIKDIFRPGHADFTYFHKYGLRDYRGGGRSSARESAARVASGAFAKMLLNAFNIKVESGICAIGDIVAKQYDFKYAMKSEICALDRASEGAQKALIELVKKSHDSIGGAVLIRASNVPKGLGEPLYHKLDAAIASALMGINAIKAVEIGDGIDSSTKRGSEHNDTMDKNGFKSNHSGGILGGISNGEDIIIKAHFKPTPSIGTAQNTIDTKNKAQAIHIKGRHDPCVAIRGCVVAESMIALILADMLLLNATAKLEHIKKIYL